MARRQAFQHLFPTIGFLIISCAAGHAASVNIYGVPVASPDYGLSSAQNNVINYKPSGLAAPSHSMLFASGRVTTPSPSLLATGRSKSSPATLWAQPRRTTSRSASLWSWRPTPKSPAAKKWGELSSLLASKTTLTVKQLSAVVAPTKPKTTSLPLPSKATANQTSVAAVVTTTLPLYNVDWYFVGAESGYTITFAAPGINPAGNLPNSPVSGQFSEANQNSNCCGSKGASSGPLFLGTSENQTSSILNFSFNDGHGGIVANGASNPVSNAMGLASMVFSYVVKNADLTWTLTSEITDWFMVAFNDSGGRDLDFDDFVAIGHVYSRFLPPEVSSPAVVPLPAALPLLLGSLGAMGWFSWRQRRKKLA